MITSPFAAPRPARRMASLTLVTLLAAAPCAFAQPAETPADRSRDRGPGVPTSMFGTYVEKGELLIYPFWEYYTDKDFEYTPSEFGRAGTSDLRGHYRAGERLLFGAFGLTDNVAIEVEAALIHASLTASPFEPGVARLNESGLGDVEGQVRWRWRRETERRPEFFSYAEVVLPHHRDRALIGTAATQIKAGTGMVRGLSWGTLTVRAAVEYDRASTSPFDVGEYAVEWLRRVSQKWRVYLGVEGTVNEATPIGDVQWHFNRRAFLRMNSGVGLTKTGPEWAPEIGVVFSLPTR